MSIERSHRNRLPHRSIMQPAKHLKIGKAHVGTYDGRDCVAVQMTTAKEESIGIALQSADEVDKIIEELTYYRNMIWPGATR